MKTNLFKIVLIIALPIITNAQNHTVHDNTTSVTLLPSGIKSDHFSNSSVMYKDNFSLGKDALKSNLNGINNTAVGIQSLQNLNGLITTANGIPYRFGNSNTAIGHQSLMSDVNGGSNVAVGASAMRIHQGGAVGTSSFRTATGFGNTAVGTSAMGNSSGGSLNVGIGSRALLKTTGIGSKTYNANTTEYQGSENVAVGASSMSENTLGRYNVAIGSGSLFKNTISANNVAIGYEALHEVVDGGMPNGGFPLSTPPANNIAIGYQAGYNELGANKLYIENSNSSTPLIGGDFANDIVGVNMPIASLAINPAWKLQVGGDINATGSVRAAGVVLTSDKRFKEKIEPLENSLSKTMKIEGVNYQWRVKEFPERKFTNAKQIGFIAQDIEKIFPEIVETDAQGYKSVNYVQLIPVLVEAIKTQQNMIDKLNVENTSLRDLFTSLQGQIDEINTKSKAGIISK
jgi:hypothetical protein